MAEMKFATTSGVTLHYIQEGIPDGVPLVFINSLGSDLRVWNAVVPYFLDDFLIIRHDKRGHGLSDCPSGPYTISDHAQDVANLLNRLQINEAILIGVSVGGVIAQDFALNHPQRIKGLVLSDTAAKIGDDELWNERIGTLRQHGMAYLAETILARWFSPGFIETHPAEYRGYYNLLTRMPLEGYIGTCEALRDCDLRETVEAITAKTLVLCGTEDLSTPPALVQDLAERLPNARFELIERAGHLPCVEQPAVMARKIACFLETL